MKSKSGKIFKIILTIISVFLALMIFAILFEVIFVLKGSYGSVDNGKGELFSNHKVLLISPHQDDEINILGGVIDQYKKYGSEIFILYTTNGDLGYSVEQRFSESKNCAEMVGIDEDHLILLGYGDSWDEGGPPIYLSSGERLISKAGRMETYGIADHPAYNDNNPYTRDNYVSDMKAVIEEISPDIIFLCDYDPHADHRTCTLLFDEAMAQILKENTEYSPLVLKSLSYDTAYAAEKDFYALNIKSTVNPFDTDYTYPSSVNYWKDRIRLPVLDETLSRSLIGTLQYRQLRQFVSQGAMNMAEGIINGDKVFFQRRTDSILYNAKVSSEQINDFKIIDTISLSSMDTPWFATCLDSEFSVELENLSDIEEIWLYDNPLPDSNILDAEITLDNGNTYHTGPLDIHGGATKIAVNEKDVKSFIVKVLKSEGDYPGLSEIEAYNDMKDYGINYLKLTDDEDNFVYNYMLDGSDTVHLKLLACGDARGEYSCNFPMDENGITVKCEKGKKEIVTVSSKDGKYEDSVVICNPVFPSLYKVWQKYESFLVNTYNKALMVVYHT